MVINGNEETLNASVINYNAKLALYDRDDVLAYRCNDVKMGSSL